MPTIEVSEDTLEKIKEQLGTDFEPIEINSYDDFIGKKIFVRTVTYHILGKVDKIIGNLIFLKNASWVADSGRFMEFIENGEPDEVEPVGDWFINKSSIVDGCLWTHKLPEDQK